MIGRLSGRLLSSKPDEIVLDVAGVGYRVLIPLGTFYRLCDAAGTISLHVHTHVREDALQLFGFWTEAERTAFERLIAISGVGPKLALAVLSGIGADDLERAIREEDRGVLERIPGIGRKTAERILLELRERPDRRRHRSVVESLPAGSSGIAVDESSLDADAASALVRLGYSDQAATDAVRQVRRELGSDARLEDMLRASLRRLVR